MKDETPTLLDGPSSATRALEIDETNVLVPINNEAHLRRVRFVRDGVEVRSFTASLGLPADWWAHVDAREWLGGTVDISIAMDDGPASTRRRIEGRGPAETNNADLAAAVRTSPRIWSSETLYKEPLRPAFHFTAMRGWLNDPNGLVYHNGRYHLFFQHNPYGLRWGNMHWGHAVSTDLVHWAEQPIALYPFAGNDFPYDGSGVVDANNTSGWGQDGRPAIVIAFTSSGRGECIAYSIDNGVSWTEYEDNPVVRHQGRDPKLLWHAETERWVMVVYCERRGADPDAPLGRGFAIHTSPDLKVWTEQSWIEGYYECPDLFALPIDDDPLRTKWVLSCAPGYYQIGTFDGSTFVPESPRLQAPSGGVSNSPDFVGIPLFYAAQTFSNTPEQRPVQIAWARVAADGEAFTEMMTFPTTLSLKTTVDGVRLCREPVDTIKSLQSHTYDVPAGPLTSTALLADLTGEAWDIEAIIAVGTVSPIMLTLGGDEYVYDPAPQALRGPAGAMHIPIADGKLRLRILVDRTTIEIFGDQGQAYGLFVRENPGAEAPLALRTWDLIPGEIHVERLTAHALRSAWRNCGAAC